MFPKWQAKEAFKDFINNPESFFFGTDTYLKTTRLRVKCSKNVVNLSTIIKNSIEGYIIENSRH